MRTKVNMQLLLVITLSICISADTRQDNIDITYVIPNASEGSHCPDLALGNCYTKWIILNQELIFLAGKHIAIVNGNQSTFLFVNGIRYLAFAG